MNSCIKMTEMFLNTDPLDAVVCDVDQLVPLPGHGPDISPEHHVLHREDARVLDLHVESENTHSVLMSKFG